jgi:hypothetical protein
MIIYQLPATNYLLPITIYQLPITNDKLCKTKPISEMPKMNLSRYKTNDYDNKSGLWAREKQSQTKPILKGRRALIRDVFLRMVIRVNCYIVFAQVAAIAKIALLSCT